MAGKRHGAAGFSVSIFVALHVELAFAISHDAATESTVFTTSSPKVFDHTPTGVPRAILVFITQAGASNDQITRVTYGGVPLNRIWSASDATGEPGRVYSFFLGNAVPTGAQSVSIVHSGSSSLKLATAITLTGANDIEIARLPRRLEQDQSNPRLELDSYPKAALRYCALYSGQDSVGALAIPPRMVAVSDNDFGSSVTRIDREISITTRANVGYTTPSDDVAMIAVAFSEITVGGGGTGPVPHVARMVTTPAAAAGQSLVDVSGASISAEDLEQAGIRVGDPVYVQAIAHLGNSGIWNRSVMALAHGSTVFENLASEDILPEVYANAGGIKSTPFLHHVWTRAPGEGLKVQFARVNGGTAQIDQVFLLAVGLAGLRKNVDWFWSEVGEERSIVHGDESSGPFTDGASLTVVPSGAIGRFAVFTTAYLEHAVTTASKPRTQLTRTGETTDSEPHQGFFGGTTTQKSAMGLMRVYSLSNGTRNNLVLQDNQSGMSSSTRKLSSIFGLNLDGFKTAADAYTRAETFLSATNYLTGLQTIHIAPSSRSPVWVSGFWGYNPSSASRNAEFRIQVDNADDPQGQTSDNHQFNGESANGGSQGYFVGTVVEMTQGLHVVELDASVDSASGNSGGEIRSLFAVEMSYASEHQVPSLDPYGLVALGFGLGLVARLSLSRAPSS